MKVFFIVFIMCSLIMFLECHPQNNLQSLKTIDTIHLDFGSYLPSEQSLRRHHRARRSARGKKIRKAKKNRKTWHDLNDADLYRYIQLRTLFRFVAYHPAEEEE